MTQEIKNVTMRNFNLALKKYDCANSQCIRKQTNVRDQQNYILSILSHDYGLQSTY